MPLTVYIVTGVIASGLVALIVVMWVRRRETVAPEDEYEIEMIVRDFRLELRRIDLEDFEDDGS